MLATPTAPTSRATAPRPRNRVSNAPLASTWAVSAAEGWETSTSLGFSGLAWAASRLSTPVTAAAGGPQVDGGGVAVEVQVVLRRGVADQHRGIDLGGQHGRVEDAGDVEPHAADPDPLTGEDLVDPQPLRGGGAEHGDRFVSGGPVQVAALGHAGAHGGRQAQAGGVDGEGVGVDAGISGLRKAFTLVTVPVSCTWVTPGNRVIIPGAVTGSSAVPPVRVWPFCTVSRLVPSRAISRQQTCLGGGRQAKHGRDGRDPDRDPERRQAGPQLAGPQPHRRQPCHVRGTQPRRRRCARLREAWG